MYKSIAFIVLSIPLIYISRSSLKYPRPKGAPRSHGFYRFFAWESILALFLGNVEGWFRDPFAWHQLISWFLLVVSLVPLAFGVRALVTHGKPTQERQEDATLLAFEKTTTLVTTGIYRYIRHPLYSSLLLLAWGIFFKAPNWPAGLLVLAATLFLYATARADETECTRFFGPAFAAYMKRSKRFLPFLF